MADAGRWAIVRQMAESPRRRPDDEAVEHVVRTLLRRWGVIFWKLLVREADSLPNGATSSPAAVVWKRVAKYAADVLLPAFAGEQYASLDAVGLLRDVRRRPLSGQYVSLSGADPLNLLGIITPGARLASLSGNRLLYRDGLPIATYAAGEVQFLETLEPKEEWEARNAVLRRHVPAALTSLDEST